MSLAEFLAAKYRLDERSLDRGVRAAFLEILNGLDTRACVDVGAGSGATVERLLEWQVAEPWRLTLLEKDAELTASARLRALRLLTERGRRPSVRGDRIESSDARIALHFANCDIARHRPDATYDAVIAHAVLDLVPLASTLERFGQWLRPGGHLYAAIDYDGDTVFEPRYRDATLEADLIACYHDSMEARRVDGERTGGAFSGRRLRALLPEHGFSVLCEGRSDWRIRPYDGRYPDEDAACLAALIGFIAAEAHASGRFDAGRLARWREDRLHDMAMQQLQLQVRNCDVLARYMGSAAP